MKHAPQGPRQARDPMETRRPMDTSYTPCTAKSKQSGQRCKRRPIPGGHVCVMHGGKAPHVQFKAMERLKALQPKAVTVLERLLDRDEFPTVQMAAVRDVMDRTEGKAAESMALSVTGSLDIVETLRRRHARKSQNP